MHRRAWLIAWLIAGIVLGRAPAAAAGLADRFRAFVLGDEAEAATGPVQDALDRLSRGCMVCHDGTGARGVPLKAAGSPLQIRGIRTVNHPVGMDYAAAAARRPRGLRAPASLPPEVRLVDGKVGCVSCHPLRPAGMSVWTDRAGCTAARGLTHGPRETDLCMTCHIK